MKCAICNNGTTAEGQATVTLERGATTVVFRSVPADVCQNCGEEYICDDVAARLLALAEEAAVNGVQIDVRSFQAA